MLRQSFRSIARINRFNSIRTYADAVNTDILKLSLVLPHESLISSKPVTQVNIPAESGEMGILANHVPVVEQLKPGVIEIIESSGSTKYFISGGFASMLPTSELKINAIEAFPLDAFSSERVKTLLSEAQKNLSSSDETVAAEAEIEVEVLEALQAVVKN